MYRTVKATTLAAFLLVVAAGGRSAADDAKTPPTPEAVMKMMAEAGKPGPEHKKLQPLVGDWNFTLKMWVDPSLPPGQFHGTIERKWIMGGRFVQESVKSEFDGKPFEGLGLFGYDGSQKKFTVVHVCGLCGKISHSNVTADASARKFECTRDECCPITGEKIKFRDEMVIESNDKIVLTAYRVAAGKEVKAFEFVSTRKQ